MYKASEELEFEEAQKFKDLIESIRFCTQKQKITETNIEDEDIIAYESDSYLAVVAIFFIRGGKLIGRDSFFLKIAKNESGKEIIRAFIEQFYSGTPLFQGIFMSKMDLKI